MQARSDHDREPAGKPDGLRRLFVRGSLRVSILSAALLVGLLAVGGLGYAMSATAGFVTDVTEHRMMIGDRETLQTITLNAANDQYGTTTATTTTAAPLSTTATTATTTTAPVTVATTTVAATGQVTATTPPAVSGSVTAVAPGTTQQTSVVWSPETFATQVVVQVDPTPPLATPALLGSQNQLVSINVTTATGEPVHALAAPIDIVFTNPQADFVPVISEDGINFRAVPRIAGPPLPDGQPDGYYIDGNGAVHILTRHLTIFAVLYKGNVTASETGRKLAAPGSGKFGDPTRIHTGAPALKLVSAPTAVGKRVAFTFFVDEQTAAYFRVLSSGRQLAIARGTSTIRGQRIGGGATKTVHLVLLRPGTIRMSLGVPRLAAGAKLQLVVVDYDGHKVAKTVAVGG